MKKLFLIAILIFVLATNLVGTGCTNSKASFVDSSLYLNDNIQFGDTAMTLATRGFVTPDFEDEETFNLAQKARESRRKNKTSNNQYLLSGLCECGVCGNAMRYQKWADGSYHKIYCYSRNSNMKRLPKYNSNCNNEIFFASDIEKEVEKQILEISLNLKLSDLDKQNENKSQILEKQLESIRNKLKRLYVIYSDGDDTVLDVIDELKKDEKELKSQIEILKSEEINVPSMENTYKEIKKIADVWEHINNQSKNNILKSIIDKIVICNDSIEIKLKNF